MKNILKKNQVIITALALMIAIAGYLQMAGNTKEKDSLEATASGNGGYEITEGNISDYLNDISEEDTEQGNLISSENEAAKAKQQADAVSAPADGSDLAKQTQENLEDPGAAILVSTTIRGDYAMNAKLYREQTRAKNKEILMNLLADDSLSEAQKQETIDVLLNMTAIAEKEQAAELLLEAKGFADAVVNIVGEEVDVVINAESVTDRQIAQIEDIVERKTGADIENIKIMAAIQQE